MNLTTDIELIEASDITIDATRIDVSEVDAEVDKAFLREMGINILTIEGKAEFAIKKIVATIQGRASLEKGKVIAQVQDRFKEAGKRTLTKWYRSVGISEAEASRYSSAYRATAQFNDLFEGLVDPEKILACTDQVLQRLDKLPLKYKEEVMSEIAVGNPPTGKEIKELADQTEVKLSKAQELLAAAKQRMEKAEERWEEVKADPEIKSGTNEYATAQTAVKRTETSVKKYEEQIATLETQIEEEKLKAAQSEEREAKAKAELQKLKFDDARTREERIKRLTSSLTVGVPQAFADLQKFFAEKEHYPEEVRKHVTEQATQLANYIGDQLV